ncbi:MAG: hypothetical protein V2I33_08540 [Kangiellaceae bacterium]|jgi:hypothetical protein|nr:hypothetical protein [Kangiellaceae bacterium]
MKLLTILLFISLNAGANEYVKKSAVSKIKKVKLINSGEYDVLDCMDEVELQYKTNGKLDEGITPKEYDEMIRECETEWKHAGE